MVLAAMASNWEAVIMDAIDHPEASLWVAVLNRSITDLEVPEERRGALAWFTSFSGDVGSFRFVADALDCDPVLLRRKILGGQRKQLQRIRVAA